MVAESRNVSAGRQLQAVVVPGMANSGLERRVGERRYRNSTVTGLAEGARDRPPEAGRRGGSQWHGSVASAVEGHAPTAMAGDGLRESNAVLRAENARLPALRVSHGIDWRSRVEVGVRPTLSALSTFHKLTLFRRLCLGRTDVYPVGWESKAGKTGDASACANELPADVCWKSSNPCADLAATV